MALKTRIVTYVLDYLASHMTVLSALIMVVEVCMRVMYHAGPVIITLSASIALKLDLKKGGNTVVHRKHQHLHKAQHLLRGGDHLQVSGLTQDLQTCPVHQIGVIMLGHERAGCPNCLHPHL
jgi:hypothetical protein